MLEHLKKITVNINKKVIGIIWVTTLFSHCGGSGGEVKSDGGKDLQKLKKKVEEQGKMIIDLKRILETIDKERQDRLEIRVPKDLSRVEKEINKLQSYIAEGGDSVEKWKKKKEFLEGKRDAFVRKKVEEVYKRGPNEAVMVQLEKDPRPIDPIQEAIFKQDLKHLPLVLKHPDLKKAESWSANAMDAFVSLFLEDVPISKIDKMLKMLVRGGVNVKAINDRDEANVLHKLAGYIMEAELKKSKYPVLKSFLRKLIAEGADPTLVSQGGKGVTPRGIIESLVPMRPLPKRIEEVVNILKAAEKE